jgi:hypothetical protein
MTEEANEIGNRDKQQLLQQPQRHSFSRSALENIVIINNLTIINGLDVANESLRMYTEFMENVIRFNMNAMKMVWNNNNPFFNLTQPKLENKE